MLPFFYPTATSAMRLLTYLLTRWEVTGKENVPQNGPVIIVANHMSLTDPPLLSACIPRRITFMAKEELFSGPGSIFIRAFGAFPVKRGTGREALHQAAKLLKNDGALGIFPEGKRSSNNALNRAESGAALIAFRSGAIIIPVGISGSEKIKSPWVIFQRPRVQVKIGKPFKLHKEKGRPSKELLDEATTIIMKNVVGVLPPDYHGVYSESSIDDHKGDEDGN